VRHGQTGSNLNEVFAGQQDDSINEAGMIQAEYCREFLKNVVFGGIYTSGLKRTAQTARVIRDQESISCPEFNEIDQGEYTGRVWKDLEKIPGFLENRLKRDYRNPGGESLDDVITRASRKFHEIIANHDDGESILIVSHGGVIKELGRYILKQDRVLARPPNCSISLIKLENGKYKLEYRNKVTYPAKYMLPF